MSETADNDTSAYRAERRLRHELMGHEGYDARERPVNISSQPVEVNISLYMYALISLVCGHNSQAVFEFRVNSPIQI